MSTNSSTSRDLLSHQPWVWDVLIGLTVCLGIAMTWAGLELMSVSPFFGIIGFLGILGIFLTLYGSFVEPKRINLNTKIIHKEDFPVIAIAVMADMHVGPYKGRTYMERAVTKLMHKQPDLILLAGDFLFDHHSSVDDLEPLKQLCAPLGVFAVVGNHDSGQHSYKTVLGNNIKLSYPDRSDDLAAFFKDTHVQLLRNESKVLRHNGYSLCVGGVDDAWMPSFDLPKTIDSMPASLPTILLSHNPEVAQDARTHSIDFIVSGHTHGGQIRLPLIGSIRPIPSTLGDKFDHGVFNLSSKTRLVITHGIGEMLARARLFCPPEIMILKVNSTNNP